MSVKLGSGNVAFRLGSATPAAVYLGSEGVWPAGATLVSTKSTGNISGSAESTTGYIKAEWWDNTSNVYGFGTPGGNINWSKAAGGAGEKTIKIYPSDASGNLAGALESVSAANNSLTSINISGLASLDYVNVTANNISSLDAAGLPNLMNIQCSNNPLLASLDISGVSTLGELVCDYTALASLDVSGNAGLSKLNCSFCALTSLRAVGVGSAMLGTYYTSGSKPVVYGGFTVDNNNLSAAALNQLYADLAESPVGILFVLGNPGTAEDDPTIATDKGWTVYGS